jgi:hypothetical protein
MSVIANADVRLWVETTPGGGLESSGGARAGSSWHRAEFTRRGPSPHPWDVAHRALADPGALSLETAAAPQYIEPDFEQSFPYLAPRETPESLEAWSTPCQYRGMERYWPPAEFQFAWHLQDGFSGLRSARDRVGAPSGRRVRVAILDTGFDPDHVTLPEHLRTDLQRNFTGIGDPGDATDPGRHFPTDNPGHGTATLALLAGRKAQLASSDFNDYLGGAPFADIVPVRIANSVVHFYTSAMARGIEYAIEAGCDVVSMSMGGVPARSWAAAVNRAYEAGVAIFAAAGNRYGPSPPEWIVYPARFKRVVAVCGVTADRTPYYKPGFHVHMQGCFGPPSKMPTALAAYTPNMPWAALGCASLVNHDGAGTSAATPQAAAAAALWLQNATLPDSIQPWQKVEAVRYALFQSADKSLDSLATYFGQGALRAAQALDVPFRADLPRTPPDEVSFPWLRMGGILEAIPCGRDLMYEVEALQLYERTSRLRQITGNADPADPDLPPASKRQLLAEMAILPGASNALRTHLQEVLGNTGP